MYSIPYRSSAPLLLFVNDETVLTPTARNESPISSSPHGYLELFFDSGIGIPLSIFTSDMTYPTLPIAYDGQIIFTRLNYLLRVTLALVALLRRSLLCLELV